MTTSNTQSSCSFPNNLSNDPCHPRPCHILLGITGSVAAVKGPEIALQLARTKSSSRTTSNNNNTTTVGAHVIVLLSKGGEHFWNKAKDYNVNVWNNFQEFMKADYVKHTTKNDDNGDGDCNDEDYLYGLDVQSFMKLNEHQSDEGCNNSTDEKGRITIVRAQDEWEQWDEIGDPVLHIQLRDWADKMIIAPLSAHTMAKIANGFCDDTLSCVVRAWNFNASPSTATSQSVCGDKNVIGKNHASTIPTMTTKSVLKPLILAPAMNTAMWNHPLTLTQLNTIRGFGSSARKKESNHDDYGDDDDSTNPIRIVDPQVKLLACGEIGAGAMASVLDIVDVAQKV